jgi:hypothetical protein
MELPGTLRDHVYRISEHDDGATRSPGSDGRFADRRCGCRRTPEAPAALASRPCRARSGGPAVWPLKGDLSAPSVVSGPHPTQPHGKRRWCVFSAGGRQDALASMPGALRPRGRPILQRRDPVPHFARRCQVPVQGVRAPILGPGSGPCSGPRFSGDPAHWRDAWQVEHVTGKYVISDNPMTEEQ